MNLGIEDLPNELVYEIADYLGPKQVGKLRQTSKRFRNIPVKCTANLKQPKNNCYYFIETTIKNPERIVEYMEDDDASYYDVIDQIPQAADYVNYFDIVPELVYLKSKKYVYGSLDNKILSKNISKKTNGILLLNVYYFTLEYVKTILSKFNIKFNVKNIDVHKNDRDKLVVIKKGKPKQTQYVFLKGHFNVPKLGDHMTPLGHLTLPILDSEGFDISDIDVANDAIDQEYPRDNIPKMLSAFFQYNEGPYVIYLSSRRPKCLEALDDIEGFLFKCDLSNIDNVAKQYDMEGIISNYGDYYKEYVDVVEDNNSKIYVFKMSLE